MRIPAAHEFEEEIEHRPQSSAHKEEENCVYHYHHGLGIRALEADHKGEHNDAEHIVYDGRADNGGSHPSL